MNSRGVRADKAGYIARIVTPGDVRFARQEVSDLLVKSVGQIAIANMTLHDTFVKGQERRTFTYLSLCVFQIENSSCQWIAGQTMLPDPTS